MWGRQTIKNHPGGETWTIRCRLWGSVSCNLGECKCLCFKKAAEEQRWESNKKGATEARDKAGGHTEASQNKVPWGRARGRPSSTDKIDAPSISGWGRPGTGNRHEPWAQPQGRRGGGSRGEIAGLLRRGNLCNISGVHGELRPWADVPTSAFQKQNISWCTEKLLWRDLERWSRQGSHQSSSIWQIPFRTLKEKWQQHSTLCKARKTPAEFLLISQVRPHGIWERPSWQPSVSPRVTHHWLSVCLQAIEPSGRRAHPFSPVPLVCVVGEGVGRAQRGCSKWISWMNKEKNSSHKGNG